MRRNYTAILPSYFTLECTMRRSTRQTFQLIVDKEWNSKKAGIGEKVSFTIERNALELELQVNANFHNDPAPIAPVGEVDGLWQYEVVELFLLCSNGHYLEIELGPHGHYLIYYLSGIREVTRTLSPVSCRCTISGSKWSGTLKLSLEDSIQEFTHVNAYAIHGQGMDRRYLAAYPLPGLLPDFHQPEHFHPIADL